MRIRKSVEQIEPVSESIRAGDAHLSWDLVEFPEDKEAIERFIFDRFLAAAVEAGFSVLDYRKNEENDFDFQLQLPGGKINLVSLSC